MELGITPEHIDAQAAWSRETFGPGMRRKGVIDHIRKELKEIEDSPDFDWTEWVDVIILGIDGASRGGALGNELVRAILVKWEKIKGRVYPDWREFSEDVAIEHDRSYD